MPRVLLIVPVLLVSVTLAVLAEQYQQYWQYQQVLAVRVALVVLDWDWDRHGDQQQGPGEG